MLTIKADKAVLEKMASLMQSEEPGSFVRLKECTLGCGCHSQNILSPSIDKQKDAADAAAVVDGVPFVVSQEMRDRYGENFELRFEEGRLLITKMGEQHHG